MYVRLFVILGSVSTSTNGGINLSLVGRHCRVWTTQIVAGVPCVLRLCSQHLVFVSIPKHGRLFDKAFKHTHSVQRSLCKQRLSFLCLVSRLMFQIRQYVAFCLLCAHRMKNESRVELWCGPRLKHQLPL